MSSSKVVTDVCVTLNTSVMSDLIKKYLQNQPSYEKIDT